MRTVMLIDCDKLNLALARRCKGAADLSKVVSADTIIRIRKGYGVRTGTLGKIADALGVDPAELVKIDCGHSKNNTALVMEDMP